MLRVWYGEDDFSQHLALSRLRQELGGAELGPGNEVVLDGGKLSFEELRLTCQALPFLGAHRLVVVEGLLSRFEGERRRGRRRKPRELGLWAALAEYVPGMPPTTELILRDGKVERDNPLLRSLAPVAEVRAFSPLRGRALQDWVRQRVGQGGGNISSGAVRLLAELIGGNLWLMANEVEKLLAFADGGPIGEEMVRHLVSAAQPANIFHLVDALVERRPQAALRLLEELRRDGIDDLQVLVLTVGQFRRLLRVKGLIASGLGPREVQRRTGIGSDWAFSKTLEQAKAYSESHLEGAYRRLLAADLGLKTGDELALEGLVLDLCQNEVAKGAFGGEALGRHRPRDACSRQ